MDTLSQEQSTELDELRGAILSAQDDIENEVDEYNNRIQNLPVEEIKESIAAYNDAITAFNEFCGDLASQMEDHFDAQDEEWQLSDDGLDFQQWLSAWQCEADELDEDTLGNVAEELEAGNITNPPVYPAVP